MGAVPEKLVGRLVTLRALREADKATYLDKAGQAEAIWGFGGSVSDVRARTPDEADRWFAGKANSIRWGIDVDGRLIGTVGLHDIDERDRHATLAIGIMDASDMGRGYGSDAIRLVVAYGLHQMNLHRIDLKVLARNKRAIRAYEKCGFELEGRLRDSALIDGRWEDDLIMSVIRPSPELH